MILNDGGYKRTYRVTDALPFSPDLNCGIVTALKKGSWCAISPVAGVFSFVRLDRRAI
eukprot:IDg19832t1